MKEQASCRPGAPAAATLTMPTSSGLCDGIECTNPPTVSIGTIRFCDVCLEKARAHYPASFTKYWAAKIAPLGRLSNPAAP
jgi:hypothetical protein